jgi:molecular chaperone DnaJ
MIKRDYYEVLEISRDSDGNTIKKSYRKLALKYHPDRNHGNKEAEDKFKESSEAYEVLSNPEKKALYDRYGHDGIKSSFSRGGFSWDDFTHFGDIDDIFGDILGSFFGGGRRSSRREANRGRNMRIRYSLSLEEAFNGKDEEINIDRLEACGKCNGSGLAEGAKPKTCPRCKGRGQIRVVQGFFSIASTCDMCGGAGQIISNPCKSCGGHGRVPVKVPIKIKIPKGIDTGMEMIIRGEGEAGPRGGPHGDLLIRITVKDHPFFKRQNDDIVCEIPITYVQAALGDEIEIPTLHGPKNLKVPAGTQTHHVIRIKGCGMPRNEVAFGSQYVQVIVKTPKRLTGRQRELLREFNTIEKDKVPQEEKGFFERFKNSINDMKEIFR